MKSNQIQIEKMPEHVKSVDAMEHDNSRQITHASELIGEIVVAAPDGEARVPFSLVLDEAGYLVVFSYLRSGGAVLDRFATDGRYLSLVARFSAGTESGQLSQPTGVAFDGAGHIYIPDTGRHCIVKLDANGQTVAELGTYGIEPGELDGPRDVDIAVDGYILVADTENHRIQVWEPTGDVRACFGPEDDEEEDYLPSGSGAGEFFRPYGITSDSNGVIWVADTNNHRIQGLSMTEGFQREFGREGLQAGALMFPIDVRVDPNGIVVVDQSGARIQRFSSEGVLECAFQPMKVLPDGATVVDVDVDDEGDVFIPVGPLGRIYRVRAGAKES